MDNLSSEQYRAIGGELRRRIARKLRSIADAVESGDVCEIRKQLAFSPKGDCDAKRQFMDCTTNCLPGASNHFIFFDPVVREVLGPYSALEAFAKKSFSSSMMYDLLSITSLIEFLDGGGKFFQQQDDGSIITPYNRDCRG